MQTLLFKRLPLSLALLSAFALLGCGGSSTTTASNNTSNVTGTVSNTSTGTVNYTTDTASLDPSLLPEF